MKQCEFDKCNELAYRGRKTNKYLCKRHADIYRNYGRLHYIIERTADWRNTPEYRAWVSMKQRCYDKNVPGYKNYGGRGIQVCEQWQKSFFSFINHIGKKPDPSLSLDRIDNNGNYEPGNVRWATWSEQMRNRRKPVWSEAAKAGLKERYRGGGNTPGILKQRYLSLETGIYFRNSVKAWVAAVQIDGKQKVLGQSVNKSKVEKMLIDYAMSM